MNRPPAYESYRYRQTITVGGRVVELVSNRAPIGQCVADMLIDAGKSRRERVSGSVIADSGVIERPIIESSTESVTNQPLQLAIG